jgi:ABC-type glycerol-3-phosphate transport system substrate-binding protein
MRRKMKKLLLSFALLLAAFPAFSMETANSVKDLQVMAMAVKPMEILMVMLTKDPAKVKKMTKLVKAYEAKHSTDEVPVVFIMALRKNKNIEALAAQFGAGPANDPAVVVFVNGRPIAKFEGVPKDYSVLEGALSMVQQAIHDYKEQQKNPPVQVDVPKSSPTPNQ